jgi:chorismate synthase
VAEKILFEKAGIEIVAWVSSVGSIDATDIDTNQVSRSQVDQSPIRCPDPETTKKMIQAVKDAKEANDSIGGTVSCVCRNLPPGLGEPVFDKMEAKLAHAMLSIPATKGFEVGSGFAGSRMHGSEHNDAFVKKAHGLGTVTNYSGGIQGGITNGEPIVFKVAFKPPATIGLAQQTVDFEGKDVTLEAKGRHDPCVVPRAVPIVEAMAALVVCDMFLIQATRSHKRIKY